MTRINCGIPPAELHSKHLMAEFREITRIPRTIKSGRANVVDIPEQFALGRGHVKFFYNKLKYLHNRYNSLYNECIKRGFNVHKYDDTFEDLPTELYNDYQPTLYDALCVNIRIQERLSAMQSNTSKS